MKRIITLLSLLMISSHVIASAEDEKNIPADLATQILEGEFSSESKESAYIKLKELMDLSAASIESGENSGGLFGIDELIQRFGEDYTYSIDSIVYDMWVSVDTFTLFAHPNNDKIQYFYGYFYPTFESVTTSDSDSDLEIVKELLNNSSALELDFNKVDTNFEDYDWSFTNQELTYIDGTVGLTYAWESKELIQIRIGYANYGKAKVIITESEMTELNQGEDLLFVDLIGQIGKNWTFIYDVQSQTKKVIWQDPLGPQVLVELNDSLMVNRIEGKNLNETTNE
ncbi:hypothetical protein ACF3NG_06565 [Aerococcaceae bacterium WGS1372]